MTERRIVATQKFGSTWWEPAVSWADYRAVREARHRGEVTTMQQRADDAWVLWVMPQPRLPRRF